MIFGINTTRDISKLSQNFTRLTAREITYNNFEISLVVQCIYAKYPYKSCYYLYKHGFTKKTDRTGPPASGFPSYLACFFEHSLNNESTYPVITTLEDNQFRCIGLYCGLYDWLTLVLFSGVHFISRRCLMDRHMTLLFWLSCSCRCEEHLPSHR